MSPVTACSATSCSTPVPVPASAIGSVDVPAIRQILTQHGRLTGDLSQLADDGDLYSAGLTSLATVGLMLALEDHFDVEFPESKLNRSTFRSINAIAATISELVN